MDIEKVFRTKTGYCHVMHDKILLTRDGTIGNLAKVTMANNIARPLIIYEIISLGLFVFAFKGFLEGQSPTASIFLILGILLVFGIIKSLNNSASPIIDRKDITGVKFKKAIPGATRSYFIIYFKNEKGQAKRRLIMLPGSLSGGQNVTTKAVEIMTSEFPHIENAS